MEKNLFAPARLCHTIEPDFFEKCALDRAMWVCGIDEAGRGPSAGPVVAAAAIVSPPHKQRALLNDSKLLTVKQRAISYQWLLRNSWFGVGIVNNRLIDEIGIVKATTMAMHRAFAQLCSLSPFVPSLILVDAMRLELPLPTSLDPTPWAGQDTEDLLNNPWGKTLYFPHSELYSYSIAAASIIAKVTRDHLMGELASTFPCHGLAKHKGYQTLQHRELLEQEGPSIIHRRSFLKDKRGSDALLKHNQ